MHFYDITKLKQIIKSITSKQLVPPLSAKAQTQTQTRQDN